MTDKELIRKLETAETGSRELDEAVALAVGFSLRDSRPDERTIGEQIWLTPEGKDSGWVRGAPAYPPHFSQSIDAAMSLVPSDWEWRLDNDTSGDCDPFRFGMGQLMDCGGATPALAICIGALEALALNARTEATDE